MSEADEDEGMTFWEHLDELRNRVLKMSIAAVVGGTVGWFFRQEVLGWLLQPFRTAWHSHFQTEPEINFPDPAGMFLAYLKLSMIAGVVFALPIIFYQLWAFIAPGLYAREKKFAIPFVGASSGLFAGGVYFGMTLAFPVAFTYLLSFAGSPGEDAGWTIRPVIMVGEYVTFISRMLLAFGTVFELPVVVFFLSVAGVLNHLHLFRFFRYFVVVAFVLGAIITPPDLLSQFLLALPLCILYGVSIIIAFVFGKEKTVLPIPAPKQKKSKSAA